MSDILPVIRVLSQPTLYGTKAVFSIENGIITSEIGYNTLNEEYVIQKLIHKHQEKKKQEASLWRLGGAIVGGFLGLQDGFQLLDMFTTAASSVVAGSVATAIQDLDGDQLKELGLEWVNTPQSYVYHRKRHRGDAARRILLIIPHPDTGEPCTTFAVQFPDGYVAKLALIKDVDSSIFMVSGMGFDTDWVEHKIDIGVLPTDRGVKLPVELWQNDNGVSMVAIPYRAPHQFMY
jgi:hypothetical protein